MSDISNAAAPSPDEVPNTTIPAPEDETLGSPVDQGPDTDPTSAIPTDTSTPTVDGTEDSSTTGTEPDSSGSDASESGSSEELTSTSTPVNSGTDASEQTPDAPTDASVVSPVEDGLADGTTENKETSTDPGTDASEVTPSTSSDSTDSGISGTDASEPVDASTTSTPSTPETSTPDQSMSVDPTQSTESPASDTSPEATTDPSTSTTSPKADDSGTLGSPDMPVASTPQEPIWPTGQPLPDGVEATQVNVQTAIPSDEVDHRFGFHKATIEGPQSTTAIHANLRGNFTEFAHGLNFTLPQSREASLAMTALEEASMWAHKAIAKGDELIEESFDELDPSEEAENQRILTRVKNLRTRGLDTPQISDLLMQLGLN